MNNIDCRVMGKVRFMVISLKFVVPPSGGGIGVVQIPVDGL
jgi:hypothetical protein